MLEKLGFMIHPDKSVIQPTQWVEFLGMIVKLHEKNEGLRKEIMKLRKAEHPTAREVSHLIGEMNAASHAVPPAPLLYRSLQRT